jgi:integrase/recombinase XerD
METPAVYTKHSLNCPHKADRHWRRCRCRKWIYIPIERRRIPAQTRSWEQAERKARQLAGEATAADANGQTVREAVKLFLEDKKQQALSPNWEYKLKRELQSLDDWCIRKGLVLLSELKLQHLEQYRKEWTGAPITRRKRQERLRSFFLYCVRHKWTPDNLASLLSPIKVPNSPTLPLTKEQFTQVMKEVAKYNPLAVDRKWRRQRATAMLLLLRWSGLRLGDAARLERSALTEDGNLRLYMQKTGESVYVPLPPDVVKALRNLENPNTKYFFWNGTTAKESTVKRWWSTLKKIFRAAGLQDAHPHQLRDTFAVGYLLAGMPIDQVSTLLGHSSMKITERHYAPWVAARQKQLEESVRRAWA